MAPKRERTLYEISSSFFAALVIVFAVAGLLVVGFGDDGPVSPEFGICLLFLRARARAALPRARSAATRAPAS